MVTVSPTSRRARLAAAALAALAACAAPSGGAPGTDLSGYAVATSAGGAFTAAWRPEEGEVPQNELFALDLLLFEGADLERPLAGAKVQVSAWMPDHGHGMARRPEAVEVSPGAYRVRGMLLHMEGLWQVFVDVIEDGASERAEFEVRL